MTAGPHRPDDECLIAALHLAAGRDPAPDHVAAAARAAFSLRLPGAVTARRAAVPAPSGVRADDRARLLRFGTGDLTVDLEVDAADGLIDLAGQVSPCQEAGTWVEVRTPCLTESRVLSAAGRFAVTGLPPGWFSVVCHREDRPPVATSWTRIRP
ncbi:hypothetical protein [Planobispora takensis]|uniref:Uncharacterized protein n=1 Tax=Planobispora takensis TaxID=1367882 RepID=A0A8J3WSJ7_9ACTN|nr:hypothetical protein [Planobispora takensis]GII00520.1 hypothetical protein Pta02_25280 [Planobispora takensis]